MIIKAHPAEISLRTCNRSQKRRSSLPNQLQETRAAAGLPAPVGKVVYGSSGCAVKPVCSVNAMMKTMTKASKIEESIRLYRGHKVMLDNLIFQPGISSSGWGMPYTGSGIRDVIRNFLVHLKAPLPPIETQCAIVAEIEAEQALVNANRDLIARMEKKIQATLARVWGEETIAESVGR